MRPDKLQPGDSGPGQPSGRSRYGGYSPYGGYGYRGRGYWPGLPSGRLNAMAIASLVCGCLQVLLFALPVFALLALVFGLVALGQIRRRGDRGKGLAVAGATLGVCGLALTVAGVLVTMASH
jgi:Domain of unknown function (DUF4190)